MYTIKDIQRITEAFKLCTKSAPEFSGKNIIVEMDEPNGICALCGENIATKIVIKDDNTRKLICDSCDCGD